MYEMFKSSTLLFLRGKLFRDNTAVFKQWLIGFVLSLAILLVVGWLTAPWLGVLIASLIGGAVQPYLFKNLKYA